MFDDLLGNLGQQQQELSDKLQGITVTASLQGGAIKVSANANKELTDIAIDKDKLDIADAEQLEDLLLEAVNKALQLAGEKAEAETQSLMKNILPPNMSNLFGG